MISRRSALWAALAGPAAVAPAQRLIGEPEGRTPPIDELINTLELERVAQRKLGSEAFAEIADRGGADRAAFDRITFRPRLMVNTMALDLTTDLFGQSMFAPILAGPAGAQQRYHSAGEVETARGATAAKAVIIVSERSSQPLENIAAEAPGFWYQVFAGASGKLDAAMKAGCKAVCLTVGATSPGLDWTAIDALRKGLSVPFLLKGVMSAAEARAAVEHAVSGIIVSSYRGPGTAGMAASIEVLPAIVEAVGGRVPILIDGGFRRGSDALKAIALGARAVIVTRPVLWGLAAYGAPGVQQSLELLQTELARDMAMCGRAKIGTVDKTLVRIHRR